MRFTSGDLTWDVGVYGTLTVLLCFFLTAVQAGDLFFSGLCLLALGAELYVSWITYVPMLREAEAWDKCNELNHIDRDSPEYRQAQQALAQREQEFREQKRREIAAKTGKTEEWLELRGK